MNRVEKVYKDHVSPLTHDQQLELAAIITQHLAEQNRNRARRAKTRRKRSIMELHGLGAEIWQGVDAQRYVNDLRDEWEHRNG